MSGPLTRHAYVQLIEGDLEWLAAQPRTLEREHVAAIVRQSVVDQYGPEPGDIVWPPGAPWWRPGMRARWTHPSTGEIVEGQWMIVEVAPDGLPLRVVRLDAYALDVWGLAGQPGAAGLFSPDQDDPLTRRMMLEASRAEARGR